MRFMIDGSIMIGCFDRFQKLFWMALDEREGIEDSRWPLSVEASRWRDVSPTRDWSQSYYLMVGLHLCRQ